jgi:hypothetical protein
MTAAAGAYSFRRLRTAYVGSAVRLQRVDTTQQDLGFAGNDFDSASAAAFCTTACVVVTWYDQSGNGLHLSGSVAPAYVPACKGVLPCMQVNAAGMRVVGASYTPPTVRTSLSVVAKRDSGLGVCKLLVAGLNPTLYINSAANQWVLTDNTGFMVPPAVADGGWHAAAGVIDGAASAILIDGVLTTGTTIAGSAAAGQLQASVGAASTVCSEGEAIFWANYALSASERTALVNNQRAYWGF